MDFLTSNFQATVILLIDGWGENAPRWLSMDRTDDKSILVPVMVCCHQASVHHLSQCWPSSMSLYVRYHFNPLHDTLYGVTPTSVHQYDYGLWSEVVPWMCTRSSHHNGMFSVRQLHCQLWTYACLILERITAPQLETQTIVMLSKVGIPNILL